MTLPDPNQLQKMTPQDVYILNLDRRLSELTVSMDALGQTVAVYAQQVAQFQDNVHEEMQDLRRELREVRAARWELEEKQLQDSLSRKTDELEQLKSQLKELDTIRGSTNERIDRAVTQRLQEESKKRQDAVRGVTKDLALTGGKVLAGIFAVALAAAVLIFLTPLLRNFWDFLMAGLGAR